MFEERQCQYTSLGIKSFELAARLQQKSKLPKRETGNWDFVEYLTTGKTELDSKRTQKREAHKVYMAEMERTNSKQIKLG